MQLKPIYVLLNFFIFYFWQRANQAAPGKRKPKTNFVEVRTFWHLYRSFDRMWIFFILAFQVALVLENEFLLFNLSLRGIYFIYINSGFQAMVIVAWSPSGSIAALFDEDVFKSVLSIFITSAFLNLLQGIGIILWYLKFFLHVTIVLVGICVLIHEIKDSFDICVPVRNYCIGFWCCSKKQSFIFCFNGIMCG